MTRIYLTALFWADATERAVKTAAQTAVALIGAEAVNVVSMIDWTEIAGVSATAAVVSVLTSIGSAQIGDNTPSLVE